jgi:ribosomal protein L7/L12
MPDLSDEQLESVLAQVRDRRMIEAIKLYREYTGAGLAEAKAAVELLGAQDAGDRGPSGELSDDQLESVLAELRANRKIQAIKLYREFTRMGLAEARTAVEQLAQANGIPQSKSGCGAPAMIFLALSAGVYLLIQ